MKLFLNNLVVIVATTIYPMLFTNIYFTDIYAADEWWNQSCSSSFKAELAKKTQKECLAYLMDAANSETARFAALRQLVETTDLSPRVITSILKLMFAYEEGGSSFEKRLALHWWLTDVHRAETIQEGALKIISAALLYPENHPYIFQDPGNLEAGYTGTGKLTLQALVSEVKRDLLNLGPEVNEALEALKKSVQASHPARVFFEDLAKQVRPGDFIEAYKGEVYTDARAVKRLITTALTDPINVSLTKVAQEIPIGEHFELIVISFGEKATLTLRLANNRSLISPALEGIELEILNMHDNPILKVTTDKNGRFVLSFDNIYRDGEYQIRLAQD